MSEPIGVIDYNLGICRSPKPEEQTSIQSTPGIELVNGTPKDNVSRQWWDAYTTYQQLISGGVGSQVCSRGHCI
jgi:hypothetical protein